MAKAKKRNPNDTTFRNINALKKRVEKLEHKLATLFRPLPESAFKTRGTFLMNPKAVGRVIKAGRAAK